MRCELCGHDPNIVAILPIKQPDGKLNTIACEECSLKSDHYCQTHKVPHIGFDDDTSACIRCIEEEVKTQGERVAAAFSVLGHDKKDVKGAVSEYLDDLIIGTSFADLGDLPLVEMVGRTGNAQNIARPIITFSKRMKISPEQAIQQAVDNPQKVFLGID